MTDVARPFISLSLIALLAACAAKPVVWQKSNGQTGQQSDDLAQCRSYAAAEADRDNSRQQNYTGSSSYGNQSTYQQNMTAYKAGKNRDGLLARCMKLKGYRQVPAL
ncbi:MAG: hypothetical protein HQ513_07975 [Rhodospirillales bacterium]|nr:hypothetical protein [Rhodospirillales bacterium]